MWQNRRNISRRFAGSNKASEPYQPKFAKGEVSRTRQFTEVALVEKFPFYSLRESEILKFHIQETQTVAFGDRSE